MTFGPSQELLDMSGEVLRYSCGVVVTVFAASAVAIGIVLACVVAFVVVAVVIAVVVDIVLIVGSRFC